MKKIIELLKQPFLANLISVLALICGFTIGILGMKVISLQSDTLHKKKACNEAYSIMCMQVHACTGSEISECDRIVEKDELCNVHLPDVQVIYKCKEDLRNINCEDSMPHSCSTFME